MPQQPEGMTCTVVPAGRLSSAAVFSTPTRAFWWQFFYILTLHSVGLVSTEDEDLAVKTDEN